MLRSNINLWSAVSIYPPVVLGIAATAILALEGRLLEVAFAAVLVAVHRYSAALLNRSNLTADDRSDWVALRVVTTVSCIGLPFYLAFTIH